MMSFVRSLFCVVLCDLGLGETYRVKSQLIHRLGLKRIQIVLKIFAAIVYKVIVVK